MSIQERQKQIIKDFKGYRDWEERYKQVIQRGKQLPQMPQEMKIEDNRVKGCQSQVWIFAKLNEGNTVQYFADGDAVIVKGLVSLLVEVYSGQAPKDILANPPHFIEKIGFKENLSPSRTNGLLAMIKQIQLYAVAFSTLSKE